jgi:hypothetical protein
MTTKTAMGMYCSPASEKEIGKNGGSCYSRDQLVHIAKSYNNRYPDKIKISENKANLWDEIEQRMIRHCNGEWCWMETLGLNNDEGFSNVFRPIRPAGEKQWLNTTDIQIVLSQYEAIYPDFVFLGPVSIDFCELADNEVCKINLNTAKKNRKTKIGIVFNTDPSTEPGKHWISMFIDISDSDPSNHEIGYFDSSGMAPLAPQIRTLIGNLKKQNPYIKLKLNCGDDICTRSIQHQKNDSECGVYSINYIVSRLTGRSWEDIVVNGRWTDEAMMERRKYYFRPNGGVHR